MILPVVIISNIMDILTLPISQHKYPAIYLILNIVNGKCYVGQTRELEQRYYDHHKGFHGPLIKNSIKKYGWGCFEFFIIERFDSNINREALKKILNDREQYWIDELESTSRDIGYNMLSSAGSTLGYKHTPESIHKMKTTKRDICGSKNPNYGRHLSIEAKSKIGNSNKGRPSTNRRPIEQIDIKSGKVVKIWDYITEAARALNTTVTHITLAVRKHKKKHKNGKIYVQETACGFKWRYAE